MLKRLTFAFMLAGLTAHTAVADPLVEKSPKLDLQEHFRDLLKDFEPQMKELLQDMQPALDDAMKLMQQFKAMDDPRHYQLPEVMPNGDIIIRRREDAPAYTPPEQLQLPDQSDSIKT